MLLALLSGVNSLANYVGGIALSPVERLSGWVSLCMFSALIGVVIFVIFTLTADRRAFSNVLDDIAAHILAVFLFKDNIRVTMRSEAGLIVCAGRLLWYSIVPVLIMSVPLSFVLAQMGMWYQNRPVLPGKESVLVSVTLTNPAVDFPDVILRETPNVEVQAGPVRLADRGEIYWRIRPLAAGRFTLSFFAGDTEYHKHFIAGDGFMRLSPKRPGRNIFDVLLYPLEKPLPAVSPIASIMIAYPERPSKVYGTNWWVFTFCVVSMVFALASKPFIKIGT